MSFASHPITGLDLLLTDPALVRGGRAGLLTHFAAVTSDLSRGVDALVDAGVDVRCLISPEHGYWGTGQAGDGQDEDRDRATGLPVLLSWTSLVCQCIKHVSGIVGEFGLCGNLLAGEADGDVLERAERPDDSADAEPGLVLHVAGDR